VAAVAATPTCLLRASAIRYSRVFAHLDLITTEMDLLLGSLSRQRWSWPAPPAIPSSTTPLRCLGRLTSWSTTSGSTPRSDSSKPTADWSTSLPVTATELATPATLAPGMGLGRE